MPDKKDYEDLFIKTEEHGDSNRYICDICKQISMGDKAEFYNPEAEEDYEDQMDLCSDCYNKLAVCGTCKHWDLGLDYDDIAQGTHYCYYNTFDFLKDEDCHRDNNSRCAEHWEQRFPFDFEKAKKLCLSSTDTPTNEDEDIE